MKCVILAAGQGKRLYPLTEFAPKPMIPVVNRPILEHLLPPLKEAGIREILVNLYHRPDALVDYFGDGRNFGVDITWRREPRLSGPAGALLVFEDLLMEERDVLVLSGDGVHDTDLPAFRDFYRSTDAQLAMVTKEIRDPGRYGVAEVDATDRIVGFSEKPSLPREASGLVSCGIYMLDPALLRFFRREGLYDYGAHLVPDMIARGMVARCFRTSSYWSDVGTPRTLLETNLDAVAGESRVRLPGIETEKGVMAEKGAIVHTSAKVVGPAAVGQGARIGAGAEVVGPSVVGPGCVIGENAYVRESVLLPGAVVADEGVAINSLIGTRSL